MDVRIGVSQTAKELDIELAEGADVDVLKADIDQALADGSTLWITDRKGRQVGVPAEKIAYLELGSPDEARRIGFGG
ncbi:MAG: DUF3107 domain-containing protein [Acidimicrobiales bacterium]|nr:DUF3107 domain-containing protein [Acidimicrobiales bacterium]HRW37336.1 DUF3107 domain-containing protein [Aquihabitans sp.]